MLKQFCIVMVAALGAFTGASVQRGRQLSGADERPR